MQQGSLIGDGKSRLNQRVFSKIWASTIFDPNRGLFGVLRSGTDELQRMIQPLQELPNELIAKATELKDAAASIVDSQGQWFTDASEGFLLNLRSAEDLFSPLLAQLTDLQSQLGDQSMPRQDQLDAVKSSVLRLREEISPLNADQRPSSGVDHPQADPLAALGRLRDLRAEFEAAASSFCVSYDSVTRRVESLKGTFSPDNLKVGGETAALETQKLIRSLLDDFSDMQAQVTDAAKSGGVGAVYRHQAEWAATLEVSLALLERPLLNLGTTSEDGGGDFDLKTDAMEAAFDDMSTQLGSVAMEPVAQIEEKVQALAQAASSVVGASGLSLGDLDGLLSDLEGSLNNVTSSFAGVLDSITSSGFLDEALPHGAGGALGQLLGRSGYSSAEEMFTSGKLFNEGVAKRTPATLDEAGNLNAALGGVSGSGLSALNETRIERASRRLDLASRQTARLAESYETAIEAAVAENEEAGLTLDELERELDKVKDEA